MTHEHETIDISNNPELLRLVEEMKRHNRSTILSNGTQKVAVVVPMDDKTPRKRTKKAKTQADYDAFAAAAGSWKGLIEAEEFKAYIRERRKTKNRPSVTL